MSFNVLAFERASRRAISEFIRSANADVVCVQEDISSNSWKDLPEFFMACRCRTGEYNLCNTILVKKTLAQFSEAAHAESNIMSANKAMMNSSCRTPRCFCAIRFAGILIANVHLCGGRFDDANWRSMPFAKQEQAQAVVSVSPDIIVGDFNAEPTEELAAITHKNNKHFMSFNAADKAAYLKYYVGAHSVFKNNGYTPVWPNSPTSEFGGIPDGLYQKARAISTPTVLNSQGFKLSDHHAIVWIGG